MEMEITNLKRCDMVKLSGQIDSASAPALETQLLELVESGRGNLALDFGEVTFLSSAGLKALLHAQIRSRQKTSHGRIALADVPPNLRDTLELVGLHHIFDMYETATEAVGSF